MTAGATGIVYLCLLSTALLSFETSAQAQKVTYSKSGAKTTASRDDYSINYGRTPRNPRNYEYYYNQHHYGRHQGAVTVPPARPTPQVPHLVLGPVKRYTDPEYSAIVLNLLNQDRILHGEPLIGSGLPVSQYRESRTTQSASTAAAQSNEPAATTTPPPKLEEAFVVAVADRGVLKTADAGELRLRGVLVPSKQSGLESRRELAALALEQLKDLVEMERIYYTVEEPSRGLDGRPLAIVHLSDGTELNKLVIESGLGTANPGDFIDEAAADRLVQAEAEARARQRGVWAK